MDKGDLSLTVIVVAAIALVVLVVLVAIFSGRMGSWISGVESCADKGGICVDGGDDPVAACTLEAGGRTASLPGTDCEKQGETYTCCITP